MENQYDINQLRKTKENLEHLVVRHSRTKKTKKILPAQLENEFWQFNIDRTRINAIQFFGQGVITYTIFVLLILPSNLLAFSVWLWWVLHYFHFGHFPVLDV